MALTQGDKKWIEERFATKKDLERFATKKDLERFATKDDLVASNVRLGLEFDKKIDSLQQEMKEKHDEVMTVLDKIMKEVVNGREHDLVVDHQQTVQNERLDRLEEAVGITV